MHHVDILVPTSEDNLPVLSSLTDTIVAGKYTALHIVDQLDQGESSNKYYVLQKRRSICDRQGFPFIQCASNERLIIVRW